MIAISKKHITINCHDWDIRAFLKKCRKVLFSAPEAALQKQWSTKHQSLCRLMLTKAYVN